MCCVVGTVYVCELKCTEAGSHDRRTSLEELPVLQRSGTEWVWGTRQTMTMVSRATGRR